MTPKEAIKILEYSNTRLKFRIDEISALANEMSVDIQYEDIDYWKRKYEAVELVIDGLSHKP
ncbi:hypothetical protein [Oscillibacter sp.]|uniref:hypothetical protein n=1 Tax=Oscillibacter sp. TaxID=1945593 RepID=UPI00289C0206|nr:hypothetical protein [Oscillibacter sp.]